MQKRSLVLGSVFFLVIVLAIGFAFNRYIVEHDYLIEMRVSCDPTVAPCFIGVCDPEMGERCNSDPSEYSEYYYSIIRRNAKHLPVCGLNSGDCPVPTCQIYETECEMRFCTDGDIQAGVECTDPDIFATQLEEIEAFTEIGSLDPVEGAEFMAGESEDADESVNQSAGTGQ